jgi:hypothetical protein
LLKSGLSQSSKPPSKVVTYPKRKTEKKKAVSLASVGKKARVERSGTLYYPCFFIAGQPVRACITCFAFYLVMLKISTVVTVPCVLAVGAIW